MSYGDVLKEIITKRRRELGLTQREFARRADLAHVTICALERGDMRDPKISTLRAIAGALDIDVLLLVMGRATAHEPAWPLRTSRSAIESLAEPYRSLLDGLVATFVRDCHRITDQDLR
ncbi:MULTISPECIES: helix-turn-helix domain-containing protein [unclassified Paraburkholderia]|uniref:helix-turn-helix domain-containing protein n=1 Tax=unclassified Paraburkholderia TaxID=2615204 RepID=UPI001612AC9B|nr:MULTISPECIES: helix-turn-helix domain-containing protein [unclassified Paraburkholderia]MBB5445344.1 transcriptional regulator with XRE-family HTH domain [Paraburkholderia sp. WSM4177]MBB5485892.1 transcriptional regulator with XRE-family HTH domain [Paraburkholderia sp. WSM4180]